MNNEEFQSQTELGKLYGVSSHKIGRWLVEVGLRTREKKPSYRAFNEGFVEQRPSTQPNTYFYVWQKEKTVALLEHYGYERVDGDQSPE